MELGHLLTRSGFTYPEVSSKVCPDFFCHLGNSVSLPWVIYYGVNKYIISYIRGRCLLKAGHIKVWLSHLLEAHNKKEQYSYNPSIHNFNPYPANVKYRVSS
jgi:hypothetical protein